MTIKQLANIFIKKSNFRGKIMWDKSKPEGAKRKLLDSSYIFSKGWKPRFDILKSIPKLINK